MNEENPAPPVDRTDAACIARALRVTLVCMVIGLSYYPIQMSFEIPLFHRIFTDMLSGDKIPMFTAFIPRSRLALLESSCLIPLAAVLTLRSRNLVKSIYILGILALIAMLLAGLLWHSLWARFLRLMDELGNPHA